MKKKLPPISLIKTLRRRIILLQRITLATTRSHIDLLQSIAIWTRPFGNQSRNIPIRAMNRLTSFIVGGCERAEDTVLARTIRRVIEFVDVGTITPSFFNARCYCSFFVGSFFVAVANSRNTVLSQGFKQSFSLKVNRICRDNPRTNTKYFRKVFLGFLPLFCVSQNFSHIFENVGEFANQ